MDNAEVVIDVLAADATLVLHDRIRFYTPCWLFPQDGQWPVDNAEVVIDVLAASITALGGLTSLLVWIYKRGQRSGREAATREAESRAHAQVETEIEALRKEISALKGARLRRWLL